MLRKAAHATCQLFLVCMVPLACREPVASEGPVHAGATDSTDTSVVDSAQTQDSGTEATGELAQQPLVDCEALAVRQDGAATFYESNPVYQDFIDHSGPYLSGLPEDVGMTQAAFESASTALSALPFVNSFMVVRQGTLVWERYFNGAKPNDSNNVHSASKSILSVALALAVEDGHVALDEPASTYLPAAFANQEDARKSAITLRHLMNMTSGIQWQEDVSEYRLDDQPGWVQSIVDLPMVADPGTEFNYATSNTHLLSAVLQTATGESTCAYVHRRLFEPLGIEAEHWGRDPEGVFSGGFNVYLTPRELMRFGWLVAQDGMWEGERLVPAGAVQEMLAPNAAEAPYGYGQLWWMREIRGYDVKIAWGYGGQLVYWVPELELLVLVTTNTGDFDPWFFEAEFLLRNHLLPDLGPPGR